MRMIANGLPGQEQHTLVATCLLPGAATLSASVLETAVGSVSYKLVMTTLLPLDG
jgi:hypothetical protein